MNWSRFVSDDNSVVRAQSHIAGLMNAIKESAEDNTLANWVRETDQRLSEQYGKQMTIDMFC
jgi:hypothetical protein